MNKQEIIFKINTLVEMLYHVGEKQGLIDSGEIFAPGISKAKNAEKYLSAREVLTQRSETITSQGSDPHPSRGVKSWSAKSFTIKIHDEDDTIEFWVDGELKNKHQSNAAAIKFEQLLMQVKDQMASWNSLDVKKEN